MKKILIAILLLSLPGCLKTRSEISGTSDRQAVQDLKPEVQQAADKEVRIQDAEANIRQLTGRIEALEQRLNSDLAGRQKEDQGKIATQNQLIEQLRIHEDKLLKVESEVAELRNAKNVSVALPVEGPKKGNAEKASADPDSWKEAEALFEKKEWTKSVLAYQKYREQNPKGRNFPDATYKIGVAFHEMGKKEEARAFYEEAVKDYPRSNAARKSQFRLKSLK